MSALSCSLKSSAVSSGAGSTKTHLMLTGAANTGTRVTRFGMDGGGTDSAAAKGTWELVKGATGGTSSTINPVKIHGHTGTIQSSGKENFTVEPSGGTVIDKGLVHAQGGFSIPREIILNPGETLSLRLNIAASVNFTSGFNYDE